MFDCRLGEVLGDNCSRWKKAGWTLLDVRFGLPTELESVRSCHTGLYVYTTLLAWLAKSLRSREGLALMSSYFKRHFSIDAVLILRIYLVPYRQPTNELNFNFQTFSIVCRYVGTVRRMIREADGDCVDCVGRRWVKGAAQSNSKGQGGAKLVRGRTAAAEYGVPRSICRVTCASVARLAACPGTGLPRAMQRSLAEPRINVGRTSYRACVISYDKLSTHPYG